MRAAEDGRTGPLPTLGEAIAAVTKAMPEKARGEGMKQGMRTERVTLEIVHDGENGDPADWPFDAVLGGEGWIGDGESVRVVEDEERQAPPTTKPATTENDYVPAAPVSRPAETRQTKAERVGGGWWFPKYDKPSAPPPPPPAPPRVHRGSGVFDANGDEVPWEVLVAALTAERDAAIREREDLREQLESVACRAATAETALEAASGGGEGEPVAWAVRYPTGRIGSSFDRKEQAERLARDQSLYELTVIPLYRAPPRPRGWLTEEEREALGNLVAAIRPSGFSIYRDEIRTVESLLARSERDSAIREREDLREQLESVACRAATAETALEAAAKLAPRANDDGGSNHVAQAASGGGDHFADASKMVEQPRGWLTEDEWKASALAADQAPESDFVTTSEGEWLRSELTALLDRSTPPKAVLPRVYCHGGDGKQLVDIKDVRAALAAAGVAVKEVP